MVQRKSASGSAADAPRSHHISSIAHLFFGAEAAEPSASTATQDLELAVFAAGCAHASAWVAAGLALATQAAAVGSPQVLVLEPMAPSPSVRAIRPVVFDIVTEDVDSGIRTLILPAPERAETTVRSSRVRWLHYGRLDAVELSDWEAANQAPRLAVAPLRWDGLVWCVAGEDSGSLVAAQTLGRLVKLGRPAHVEVVVMHHDAVARRGPGLGTSIHELAAVSAAGAPVTVVEIPFGGAGDLESAAPLLMRIATRLINAERGARQSLG